MPTFIEHEAQAASNLAFVDDFYCAQNHFVEFGTRNAKATDKTLLQLLKTI